MPNSDHHHKKKKEKKREKKEKKKREFKSTFYKYIINDIGHVSKDHTKYQSNNI